MCRLELKKGPKVYPMYVREEVTLGWNVQSVAIVEEKWATVGEHAQRRGHSLAEAQKSTVKNAATIRVVSKGRFTWRLGQRSQF